LRFLTNVQLISKMVRDRPKGSVKEPNKFHIYETEKITRKAK